MRRPFRVDKLLCCDSRAYLNQIQTPGFGASSSVAKTTAGNWNAHAATSKNSRTRACQGSLTLLTVLRTHQHHTQRQDLPRPHGRNLQRMGQAAVPSSKAKVQNLSHRTQAKHACTQCPNWHHSRLDERGPRPARPHEQKATSTRRKRCSLCSLTVAPFA